MADEPHSKTLLVAFIKRVKALMDEVSDLNADIADVCKEAKDAGFEPTKIREVSRWLRKIDKHGREKVDEAEEIFDLYRTVVDGGASTIADALDTERDRKLLSIFAPDDQDEKKLNARRRSMKTALAMARAAQQARQA